jgi:hypothetical protein
MKIEYLGIFNMTFEKNKHGIEMDFAVNHLGYLIFEKKLN